MSILDFPQLKLKAVAFLRNNMKTKNVAALNCYFMYLVIKIIGLSSGGR